MENLIKYFRPQIKAIDESEFVITAIISDYTIDRDKELILPQAWRKGLQYFKKHPILISSHDYRDLRKQIGEVPKITVTENGIEAKIKYYVNEGNPEADWAWVLAQKGKAMFSIGFIPNKFKYPGGDGWEEVESELKKLGIKKDEEIRRVFTDIELLEVSQVLVGSNRNALQTLAAKSIETEEGKLAREILDEFKDIPDFVTKPEPDVTENYIRIRVRDPEDFVPDSFRTITLSADEGIKAVIGKLKSDPDGSTKVQSYLFDKDKWTVEEAERWVEQHRDSIDFVLEENKEINFEMIEMKEFLLSKREKGVIPFKETPKAPEDEPWDAGKEVREAEVEDLKIMCAWFDSENPDIKSSYKLPHHKAKGEHSVVWNGVRAAMAALMGARGGVDIPSGDKKGVYNHLVKHYDQFDKEPPEFRDYDEFELKEMFPEFSEFSSIYKLLMELKDKVDSIKKMIESKSQPEPAPLLDAELRKKLEEISKKL